MSATRTREVESPPVHEMVSGWLDEMEVPDGNDVVIVIGEPTVKLVFNVTGLPGVPDTAYVPGPMKPEVRF